MPRKLAAADLVGVQEIAQMAGVTSQAVTNWEARYADFPQPLVRLASGPVWEWKRVVKWLEATGRLVT